MEVDEENCGAITSYSEDEIVCDPTMKIKTENMTSGEEDNPVIADNQLQSDMGHHQPVNAMFFKQDPEVKCESSDMQCCVQNESCVQQYGGCQPCESVQDGLWQRLASESLNSFQKAQTASWTTGSRGNLDLLQQYQYLYRKPRMLSSTETNNDKGPQFAVNNILIQEALNKQSKVMLLRLDEAALSADKQENLRHIQMTSKKRILNKTPKKRGRPRKNSAQILSHLNGQSGKFCQNPDKTVSSARTSEECDSFVSDKHSGNNVSTNVNSVGSRTSSPLLTQKTPKKRGRPRKMPAQYLSQLNGQSAKSGHIPKDDWSSTPHNYVSALTTPARTEWKTILNKPERKTNKSPEVQTDTGKMLTSDNTINHVEKKQALSRSQAIEDRFSEKLSSNVNDKCSDINVSNNVSGIESRKNSCLYVNKTPKKRGRPRKMPAQSLSQLNGQSAKRGHNPKDDWSSTPRNYVSVITAAARTEWKTILNKPERKTNKSSELQTDTDKMLTSDNTINHVEKKQALSRSQVIEDRFSEKLSSNVNDKYSDISVSNNVSGIESRKNSCLYVSKTPKKRGRPRKTPAQFLSHLSGQSGNGDQNPEDDRGSTPRNYVSALTAPARTGWKTILNKPERKTNKSPELKTNTDKMLTSDKTINHVEKKQALSRSQAVEDRFSEKLCSNVNDKHSDINVSNNVSGIESRKNSCLYVNKTPKKRGRPRKTLSHLNSQSGNGGQNPEDDRGSSPRNYFSAVTAPARTEWKTILNDDRSSTPRNYVSAVTAPARTEWKTVLNDDRGSTSHNYVSAVTAPARTERKTILNDDRGSTSRNYVSAITAPARTGWKTILNKPERKTNKSPELQNDTDKMLTSDNTNHVKKKQTLSRSQAIEDRFSEKLSSNVNDKHSDISVSNNVSDIESGLKSCLYVSKTPKKRGRPRKIPAQSLSHLNGRPRKCCHQQGDGHGLELCNCASAVISSASTSEESCNFVNERHSDGSVNDVASISSSCFGIQKTPKKRGRPRKTAVESLLHLNGLKKTENKKSKSSESATDKMLKIKKSVNSNVPLNHIMADLSQSRNQIFEGDLSDEPCSAKKRTHSDDSVSENVNSDENRTSNCLHINKTPKKRGRPRKKPALCLSQSNGQSDKSGQSREDDQECRSFNYMPATAVLARNCLQVSNKPEIMHNKPPTLTATDRKLHFQKHMSNNRPENHNIADKSQIRNQTIGDIPLEKLSDNGMLAQVSDVECRVCSGLYGEKEIKEEPVCDMTEEMVREDSDLNSPGIAGPRGCKQSALNSSSLNMSQNATGVDRLPQNNERVSVSVYLCGHACSECNDASATSWLKHHNCHVKPPVHGVRGHEQQLSDDLLSPSLADLLLRKLGEINQLLSRSSQYYIHLKRRLSSRTRSSSTDPPVSSSGV